MKASIAISESYFGTLPKGSGLFMASVARNPNITWFLFSNDDSLAKHPANLVVHKMSLREFNALCEEKLGFDPASFMTAAVSSVTGTRVAKKFPVRTL